MGKRIDEQPYEYGDDCLICTDAGAGLWDPGETPARIFCVFENLTKCPTFPCTSEPEPPNGHIFALPQRTDDLGPCYFYLTTTDWYVGLSFQPGAPAFSELFLYSVPGNKLYFLDSPHVPACETLFVNSTTCDNPNHCASGGFAQIAWGADAIRWMQTFGIPFDGNTFLEFFPFANGNRVTKLCNKTQGTNIKILHG
jgi:hypothetical protein